jgi:hypothetical protein
MSDQPTTGPAKSFTTESLKGTPQGPTKKKSVEGLISKTLLSNKKAVTTTNPKIAKTPPANIPKSLLQVSMLAQTKKSSKPSSSLAKDSGKNDLKSSQGSFQQTANRNPNQHKR